MFERLGGAPLLGIKGGLGELGLGDRTGARLGDAERADAFAELGQRVVDLLVGSGVDADGAVKPGGIDRRGERIGLGKAFGRAADSARLGGIAGQAQCDGTVTARLEDAEQRLLLGQCGVGLRVGERVAEGDTARRRARDGTATAADEGNFARLGHLGLVGILGGLEAVDRGLRIGLVERMQAQIESEAGATVAVDLGGAGLVDQPLGPGKELLGIVEAALHRYLQRQRHHRRGTRRAVLALGLFLEVQRGAIGLLGLLRFGREIGLEPGLHQAFVLGDVAGAEGAGGEIVGHRSGVRRSGGGDAAAGQLGDGALDGGVGGRRAIGEPGVAAGDRDEGDLGPATGATAALENDGVSGIGARIAACEAALEFNPPGAVGRQRGEVGGAGRAARSDAGRGLLPGAAEDIGAAAIARDHGAGFACGVLADGNALRVRLGLVVGGRWRRIASRQGEDQAEGEQKGSAHVSNPGPKRWAAAGRGRPADH